MYFIVERNINISKACVNDRPYFRYLTKNPLKKNTDFETREPEVLKC